MFLTVNLPDIVESTLNYDLTASKLSFKAKAGRWVTDRHLANREINDESQPNRASAEEKEYELDIEFFEEIVPEVRSPLHTCFLLARLRSPGAVVDLNALCITRNLRGA